MDSVIRDVAVKILKKNWRKNIWRKNWRHIDNIAKKNRYCSIQKKIPNRTWFQPYNHSRKYITTITRLRFGHACYPTHLHKIRVLENDRCPNCDKKADLDHISFECQKYKNETDRFIQQLHRLKIPAPFNILSILANGQESMYNALVMFLSSTKIVL
uniref:Uncharacterized protein LOC114329420 n=1 Tax=Diabrotica virgifera virgifera TaxID=50390 RepID=A0A6P7FHB2_DIAVI